METLNSAIFYTLSALIIIGAIAAIVTPKTIYSVLCAAGVFWAVSGIFLLLNADFNAAATLCIYGVGVSILLVFSILLGSEKDLDKTWLKLKMKTFWAPFAAFLTFLCSIFFITNAVSPHNYTIAQNFSFETFSVEMLIKFFFAFELISILLLMSLVAISSLLSTKKGDKACG